MHDPAETATSSGDTPGTWIRVGRGSTLRTLPAWDRGGHLRSRPETLAGCILEPAFPRLPSRLPPWAEDGKVEGRGPGTGSLRGQVLESCPQATWGQCRNETSLGSRAPLSHQTWKPRFWYKTLKNFKMSTAEP